MQNCEKILDPAAEIGNSICVSATFQGNVAPTNQDNLFIIQIRFSRRF
jgi:hypothetical protein